eukprot:4103879-Ditylum_brightwellii.AAC.1
MAKDAIAPTERIIMLPFNCGIDSDHRAFICDINQKYLLPGDIHQIQSKNPRKNAKIIERTQQLEEETKYELSEGAKETLYQLDKDISDTLLEPEKQFIFLRLESRDE